MNRFLFGRGWVYQVEADDGTQGGAAGGGAASGGGAGGKDLVEGDTGDEGGEPGEVQGDGAAAGGAGAGAKKEEAPKDMKAAIDAALGYAKKPEAEDKKPAAKADEKKPAADGKETDTHHANGTPKKNDKGEALDAEGKLVKQAVAKPKTAAELDLKPEERKLLHAKTQGRFGEVINTLKAHEGTIAKQSQDIKVLTEARDAILGVMEETKTSQDQLAGYLEFNALLQSSDPKDLQSALDMVEEQRAALYKALGKEPTGGDIDLLADFPDLKKQVDDEEITRAAALEIAHGRRDKAARAQASTRAQNDERQKTQSAEQKKQASENALKEIEKWTAELAKGDLDYKAKEDKLLGETLEGVLKEYPPHLWLPTLKRLYAGIVIQKAPPVSGQNRPLRPSGARPGDKAPATMKEAIDAGLGYAGTGKG